MNTRSNLLAMTSAAMLLGLAWNGSTMAQQTQQEMPNPEVNRASCEDVEWHRNLLRDYPWVADACQEAIIVDGMKWARFEADFQQRHNDGSITSNFKDDSGRSLGSVRLMPGENQRVTLDGRPYQFSELRRGQTLNFYAPDNMYAFTTEPGAPEREHVQIVDRDTTDQSTADRSTDDRSSQMARAERQDERRPDTLPATAGPLPIIALGGLLSLLGGVAMTARRRRNSTKA